VVPLLIRYQIYSMVPTSRPVRIVLGMIWFRLLYSSLRGVYNQYSKFSNIHRFTLNSGGPQTAYFSFHPPIIALYSKQPIRMATSITYYKWLSTSRFSKLLIFNSWTSNSWFLTETNTCFKSFWSVLLLSPYFCPFMPVLLIFSPFWQFMRPFLQLAGGTSALILTWHAEKVHKNFADCSL
jgi:hypothetical protein